MHHRHYLAACALFLFVGCGEEDPVTDAAVPPHDAAVEQDAGDATEEPDAGAGDAAVDPDAGEDTRPIVQYEEHFDEASNTTYYLTRVRHRDMNGELVPLEHAHASEQAGETALEFSARMGSPALVFNASMGVSGLPSGTRQPVGIQIIDGAIVQERSTIRYTLGIMEDNELVAYPQETTAAEILADGAVNALTAFTPLIVDHVTVDDDVLGSVGNYSVAHPRQVIAQFENLELLILSCGGRDHGGDGMTAQDVIRILQDEGVEFAFMLDGGGSVSTVIDGELITERIDGSGTLDRPRPNFLYIE